MINAHDFCSSISPFCWETSPPSTFEGNVAAQERPRLSQAKLPPCVPSSGECRSKSRITTGVIIRSNKRLTTGMIIDFLTSSCTELDVCRSPSGQPGSSMFRWPTALEFGVNILFLRNVLTEANRVKLYLGDRTIGGHAAMGGVQSVCGQLAEWLSNKLLHHKQFLVSLSELKHMHTSSVNHFILGEGVLVPVFLESFAVYRCLPM